MANLGCYSVLMSLYDHENPQYFKEALESMIGQTVAPSQIVIVEDGPIGIELETVLGRCTERYCGDLTIVHNEKNLGLGLSLNKGLAACKNELVARMDTDDVSLPRRCAIQLERFAGDPSLDIVGSNVDEFEGETTNIVSVRKVPENQKEIYSYAKRRSAFNHPAVMYRKSSVLKCGGYRDLRRNQDVDLFGRMLYAGCRAHNIQESLVLFRSGSSLAQRRKSWSNTKSYIQAINGLRRIGYSSWLDVLIVAAAQLGMFALPVAVQNVVYRLFLR